MLDKSTSSVGHSIRLVGVVGMLPAGVTVVCIMHAKSGNLRPCAGCWCWHVQGGAGGGWGEWLSLTCKDHVAHMHTNAALLGTQVLQLLCWTGVT